MHPRVLLGLLCVCGAVGLPDSEVVSIVHPHGSEAQEILEHVARKYKEGTGVEVVPIREGWGTLYDVMIQNLTKGQGADIVTVGSTWASDLYERGLLTSISTEMTEWRLRRGADVSADFVRNLDYSYLFPRKGATSNIPEWHVLPMNIDTPVLFYRKDLYRKYLNREAPPDTIPQATEFGRMISEAAAAEGKVIHAFGVPDTSGSSEVMQQMIPWVHGNGSSFVGEGGACVFEEGVFQTSLASYVKMFNTSHPYRNIDAIGLADHFRDGNLVHVNGATWLYGGLLSKGLTADDIGVSRLPQGPRGRYSFLGGSAWALPSWVTEEKRAKAWAFLEYFMEPQAQHMEDFIFSANLLPAYESLKEAATQEGDETTMGAFRLSAGDEGIEIPETAFTNEGGSHPNTVKYLASPAGQWFSTGASNITVTFSRDTVLDSYSFMTGASKPCTDPAQWRFLGWNTTALQWDVLDSRTEQGLTRLRNTSSPTYTLDRNVTYSAYKLHIVGRRGAACNAVCTVTYSQLAFSIPLHYPQRGFFKVARMEKNATIQRIVRRVLGGDDISTATRQGCLEMDAVTYDPPASGSSTSVTIVIVVITLSCALVAVAAAFFFFNTFQARERARRTQHAPREGEISIVFTDIQKSSELWGIMPGAMTTALETHHQVMRTLIAKYEGYEVKTIGDAFMVAFNSPAKAANFACAVQTKLLEASWPAELESHHAARSAELFKGLRVRIGVHIGTPRVIATPQGGYDYEGNAVNTASRVADAGSGGQVVITEEFYNVLEVELDALDSQVDITMVGEYYFNGIVQSVAVLQMLPKSLAGRTFPALRNVEEAEESAVKFDDSHSVASSLSQREDIETKREVVSAMQDIRRFVVQNYGGSVPIAHFASMLISVMCHMGELRLLTTLLKLGVNSRIKGSKDSELRTAHPLAPQLMAVSRRSSTNSCAPTEMFGSRYAYSLRWGAMAELLRALPAAAVTNLAAKLLRGDFTHGEVREFPPLLQPPPS